jgi:adenylate cyclase
LPLLASPPETSPVVVVDIDRESLARYGAWPWRRQILADLVRKIAEAKPRVIGLDILLSEPDRFSPIGLVRNLGTEADRSGIADLVRKLPDGDAALADALKAAPVVLGFVLDPGAGEIPPGAPILARGRLQLPDIWQAGGAIGPVPAVAAAGRGLGAMVLADDVDGDVRRVPLLVLIGDRARPGLAAEVLRVGYDASSFIADAVAQRLHIGPLIVPIDADAAVRILPRPEASWRLRTVSAARILADDGSRSRLAGRIVLVGSGAPQVGGLRATPVSATTPTVQIQADAIETLSGGAIPQRPPWVSQLEILGALVLGLAALALAMLCRPVTATALWSCSACCGPPQPPAHSAPSIFWWIWPDRRRLRSSSSRRRRSAVMRATSGASARYAGASNSIWHPTSSDAWLTSRTGSALMARPAKSRRCSRTSKASLR